MQKSELIRKVTEETGLPLSTVESVLNTTFLTIAESVASGEKVTIAGFGTFERKVRSARTGINPRTKEKVEIPESLAPTFKAGKSFKAACSKK